MHRDYQEFAHLLLKRINGETQSTIKKGAGASTPSYDSDLSVHFQKRKKIHCGRNTSYTELEVSLLFSLLITCSTNTNCSIRSNRKPCLNQFILISSFLFKIVFIFQLCSPERIEQMVRNFFIFLAMRNMKRNCLYVLVGHWDPDTI